MGAKLCGIYKITNKINNKKYIGRSIDIIQRWKTHRIELDTNRHKNDYLQKAWNKYGGENFEFEILELCEPEDLNQLEKKYIKKYATFDNKEKGYNLQSGGDFPKASKSTREKISKSNKGRLLTEEHKNKLSKTRRKMKTPTGLYRVTRVKDDTCLEGYRWVYGYKENDKRIEISRTDLLDLKKEVIKRGLEWIVNDEYLAFKNIFNDKNKIKPKKTLSDEHKLKISSNTSTTGFFRVNKHKDETCLKGFRYVYRYYECDKRKELSSVDILKLKEKVIGKGLEWAIVDQDKAKITLKESNKKVEKKFIHHTQESKERISKANNSLGIFRVTKKKSKSYKQGFCYEYSYFDENNKKRKLSAVNLIKLKEKVIAKGLTWKEF